MMEVRFKSSIECTVIGIWNTPKDLKIYEKLIWRKNCTNVILISNLRLKTNDSEQSSSLGSMKNLSKNLARFPIVCGSQIVCRPQPLTRSLIKATHLCWEEKQSAFPVACIIFPALVLSWMPWDRRNFPSSFSSWDKTVEKTKRSHEQQACLLQRRQITKLSCFQRQRQREIKSNWLATR